MITFTVALLAGTTLLSDIADHLLLQPVGLRISLALCLVALMIVALAENGRVPVDNPATHLELTMVHEAMVLEYSGRHLAMIEWAAALKLTAYLSLIACLFVPFGMATSTDDPAAIAIGLGGYFAKLVGARGGGGAGRGGGGQDAGVPRRRFRRRRLRAGLDGDAAAVRVEGLLEHDAQKWEPVLRQHHAHAEVELSRRICLRAMRPR